MVEILDVPLTAQKDCLWAYLAFDANGEGICGVNINGMWAPLITGDEKLLPQMGKAAQQLADHTGREIKLVKFTVREEIETIGPKGAPDEAKVH